MMELIGTITSHCKFMALFVWLQLMNHCFTPNLLVTRKLVSVTQRSSSGHRITVTVNNAGFSPPSKVLHVGVFTLHFLQIRRLYIRRL